MQFRPLLAAALCAAFFSLPAFAAKPDRHDSLDEVVKRVQAQQKQTRTIQADFRQQKTVALLSKPESSSGRFVYSAPNNVLWSYDAPKRIQMLITNGVLTTYYLDLGKAERFEVKRYQDRIFKYVGASGAIDDLAAFFNFTFSNAADKPEYVLDLAPKTKGIAKRVKHIKIWIDKQTSFTTKFEYTEADGDLTRYEFSNVRINQPVDQGRFSLALPNSVRVEQMKLQ